MALRTKTIWTGNIDDALNYSIERWSSRAEDVLRECAEFLGEDYEAERQERNNRRIDKMVLAIIGKIYPMNYLDNFDYLAGLQRLAISGQIKKKARGGWRVA